MFSSKVFSIFKNVEKQSSEIINEIDALMENVLSWADELKDILLQEYIASKDSAGFLLPKTPSERKTRNRRPRNGLVSKCSTINSTYSQNETICLDDTISSRTRGARKAAISKISQLNFTKLQPMEESAMETSVATKNTKVVTDTTFVLPKGGTRTKPVLRNVQKEPAVTEPPRNENEVLNTLNGTTEKGSPLRRVSKSSIKTSPEVLSKQQSFGNASRQQSSGNARQRQSPRNVSQGQFPEGASQRQSVRNTSQQQSSINAIQRQPSVNAIQRQPSVNASQSQPSVNASQRQPSVNSSQRQPSVNASQRRSSRIVSASPAEAEHKNLEGTPITINETLTEDSAKRKSVRTLSGGPFERSKRSRSKSIVLRSGKKVSRSLSNSPVTTSRSSRNRGTAPLRQSKSNSGSRNTLTTENLKVSDTGARSPLNNETITIKKEMSKGLSTYLVINETFTVGNGMGGAPAGEKSFVMTKTSAPTMALELVYDQDPIEMEMDENVIHSTRIADVTEHNTSATTFSVSTIAEVSENAEIPKKKRKVKKDEEVKENVEAVADTVRITRTKSKAIRKMMEENEAKQADLSAFAKKLINRAKMTSLKKNQLAALLECNSSTPTNKPGQLASILPFGNLTASKSKYHLLLSGSKKLKTPLATLPNSAIKIIKGSEDKDRMKLKAVRDSSGENAVRSGIKPGKDDNLEKEIRLQSKKEKEKEAALKRQIVIKSKQEELKRKNELKHQMAMKKREKLEQEKYNLILSEKEKEERHKLLLQERQMKLKEEAVKRKLLTQQKIAETVERRRQEEEARLAKIREMEAEEQRLALERQKEQERQEKRAQERLAQKKAREEYEMQLKMEREAERLRAEKILTAKKCLASASKLQSASKRQKFEVVTEKKEWDYKARNENDYGLEDEFSEVDSEDEKSYDKSKPVMPWAKKIMHGKSPVVKVLTLEMLCEFLPCYQKSPDIYKMFRMTPSKRIKRSSSAIWNTPSS